MIHIRSVSYSRRSLSFLHLVWFVMMSIYYVYPQSSWWQMIRIDKLRKFKMKFQFIKRLGSLLQFLNNNFRNFYPWTYKNTFTSCQSNFWFRIRWKRWRLNHHRNSMERWPRFRRWFSGFRIGKSAQACRSIFRRRGHPNYEGQVDQTSKIVHWSIPTITGKVNITVMHLNLKKDNQRNGNQFLWYISTIRNAE